MSKAPKPPRRAPRRVGPKYADVARLRGVCDPFAGVCWWQDLDRPLTLAEVHRAAPVPPSKAWDAWPPPPCPRETHAGRVRWFVEHGWRTPIAVDVGVPNLGCHVSWPVIDGNHRFAAAIVRGDARIRADFAGDVRLVRRYAA